MYTFLLLLQILTSVLCANILYVSLLPSPSHHVWNRILAVELANKGHNVTLLDPDKDSLPKPTNFSHILVEGVYEAIETTMNLNDLASISSARMIFEYQEYCLFSCKNSLKSAGFQKLLNYPPDFKFDLLIIDVTCGTCYYPLIDRFKYPPTIGATAFLLPSYVSHDFGNHLHPSYVPWYGLPYSTNMNFIERVWNFLFTHIDTAVKYTSQYTKEHEIAKKFFGNHIPSMTELGRHISLVLANTDPLLDYPQPLSPNIIPVGGLHTRKSKDLPKDLQSLLDDAKNGVIMFSLGTNIRSDKLDQNTQRILLNAFSQLSQTVIWKFESEINDLPKNVIVRKWLPQNNILAHPNVKLFIGHGGALSTQEAIFHGVPMICIPFIVDQYVNTRIIVEKELGLHLDIKKVSAEYVLKLIREVLNNPMYTQNMRKVSSIFKDRKETPLERAVFWTEYAIRHKGAHFLSTPARDLPFYKANGLDVVLFLSIITFLIIFIVYRIIFFTLKFIFIKKKSVKTD